MPDTSRSTPAVAAPRPLRLCIIGNSHVACLKLAWDQAGGDETIQPTFFGARGNLMGGIESAGRALVAPAQRLKVALLATGGADHIDLDAYDVFCAYGMRLKIPEFAAGYSSAVRRAAVQQAFEQSTNAVVTRLLATMTTTPILIVADPLLSSGLRRSQFDDALCAYDDMIPMLEQVCDSVGARFVPQAPATLDGPIRTAQTFAQGSTRLDIGAGIEIHDGDEPAHMNAAYGKLMLADIFAAAKTAHAARSSVMA